MLEQHTSSELVQLAFDEIRRASASNPAVCLYLLAALESVTESLEAVGLHSRTEELRRQARLTSEGCGRTAVLEVDVERVHETYRRKFSA